MLIKHLVLLACMLACGAAQAQARNDLALRGMVVATPGVADPVACQNACQSTAGCSGYSFERAAKNSCTLLGGTLTDVAIKGAVSCRMPCTAAPAPAPSVQAQRLPLPPLLKSPAHASDKPATLSPQTPGLAQRMPSANGTASNQSASFGTGPVTTPLPPCDPNKTVTRVGSCSNAATPATPAPPPPPVDMTVTLLPINDNTIASSSLSAVYQQSVYQFGYWTQNMPGIGMGCDQLFVAGTGINNISCARGLIKFNLAQLAGKTIQSATLRLTSASAGVGQYKDPWYIAAGASPWSGATVTWLNYVDQIYLPSKSNHAAPTSAGQIYNLDQTVTVRNWVAGSYANNGFALALQQEQLRNCGCISLDHFEFHSSEDQGGRGPKLIVTYR